MNTNPALSQLTPAQLQQLALAMQQTDAGRAKPAPAAPAAPAPAVNQDLSGAGLPPVSDSANAAMVAQNARQQAAQGAPSGPAGIPTSRLAVAQPGTGAAPGAAGTALPGDQALSAFLQQGGGAHQAGLGSTDKAYLETLRQQAADTQAATKSAVDQNGQAVSAFADQSKAISAESQAATVATQQQLSDNKRRHDQLVAEQQERQTRIQAKLDQLEAQGVNPNHYWQDQSTGSKILAGITVALGGLSAGLNPHLGGHNAGLEIINSGIANDIDAQKENLHAHITLLDKRMGLNAQGFDQQEALLKAERDSIQTGYTIAANEATKKLAMYKDNADLQQRNAQFVQAIQSAGAQRVDQKQAEIYALKKRGEQVVAGGNPLAKYIKDHTDEVIQKAASNGVTLTVPQAQAYLASTQGVNVPNASAVPSLAKIKAGPAGQSAGQLAAGESALSNIDKLIAMRQNAGVIRGPENNAASSALSLDTRALMTKALGGRMNADTLGQFTKLVPEDPLEHNVAGIIGQDPTMSRLQMARQSLQTQMAQLRANPSSGPEVDEDNPAGGKAED